MADQFGLRKDTRGYVKSLAPDVCKMPNGTPVPFDIVAQFSDAIREVSTVRFEGKPATNINARLSRVVGDEPGVGGGVISQVNMGMCRPMPGTTSDTFRVGGEWLIHSDMTQMEMNCNGPDGPGNTIGQVTWSESAPSTVTIGPDGQITGLTNPAVLPETEEEKGFFGRMKDKASGALSAVGDAISNMSVMDGLHLALDVAGLIPGIGEIADGANALLYLAEGDYANAALSAAAMIPFAGAAATTAKYARKVDALAGAVRAADRAAGAASAAGRAATQAARRVTAPLTRFGGKVKGNGAVRAVRERLSRWRCGDPVDAVSGEVLIEITDIESPGTVPLSLVRTWRSQNEHTGRFGRGWTSMLDQSLLVNRAHSVAVLRLDDGVVLDLPLPPAGGETVARAHGLRLVAEVDGYPTLTEVSARASGDGQASALPQLSSAEEPEPSSAPTASEAPTSPEASGERAWSPKQALGPPPNAPVSRYRVVFESGRALVLERAGAVSWPDVAQSGREWRIARLEDTVGNAILIEDDARGHLAAIVDSAGRRFEAETNRDGLVLSLSGPDPSGRPRAVPLAQFAYDDEGRLVSSRDATNEPERFAHDSDGRIVSRTRRGGARVYWEYEAFEHEGESQIRCVRTWGSTPDGQTGLYDYRLAYDLDAGTTRVTDPRGGVTTLAVDHAGRVVSETDPLGRVTEFRYDPVTGSPTVITDPLGNATRMRYARDGSLAEVVPAGGAPWRMAYDESGRPTELTDPAGSTWARAYDAHGRLAEEIGPDGTATRYRYNDRGLPMEIREGTGEPLRLTWNADGQLAARTDRTGATERYAYDALGRLTRRTDAEGGETHFVYDPAGRLLRITAAAEGDSDGPTRTTRFRYDAAGNVSEVIDPDGAVRRFTHDPLFGLITAATRPSGASTQFQYDADGDLVAIVDATERTWSFARDLAGQVVEEIDFTGRRLRYGYDRAGRLAESIDARGLVTRMARDAAGRLTERTFAAGTDHEAAETFAYDPLGRLLEARTPSAAVGFAYDAFGHVVEEWQRLTGGASGVNSPVRSGIASVQSAYDERGHRVGCTTPSGRELTFGHDAEGRLVSISDESGTIARHHLDKRGRLKRQFIGEVSDRPAASGVRSYTAFGELAEQRLVRDAEGGRIGLTELLHRTYTHDDAGRLRRIEDTRRGQGLTAESVVTLSRDADGWLASSVYPERGVVAYLSDAAGNVPAAPVRLPSPTRQDSGAPPEASGETADARGVVVAVRVAEGWTLGYDADGNLLSKADASDPRGVSWRYAYDAAGRLSDVWRDEGGGEFQVGRYRYDAFGRRVSRETWTREGVGIEERMVWCGDVPAERRRSRAPEAQGLSEGASVEAYVFSGAQPVAVLAGSEEAFVLECDQVGQPRLAVDRNGEVVWEGRFDVQGREIETTGRVRVDFRFPGQMADAESGLRYNRFRYYDPDTRAYTRADPVGVNGGFHPHNYVPDPTSWIDPLGLTWRPKGPGTPGNPSYPDVLSSTGQHGAPDFKGTKHLLPTNPGERNIVKIKLQGSRSRDFTQAYKEAGISGSRRADVDAKYTWHHLDDFDPVTGESSMQLVETRAHQKNTPHRGSADQFAKHFGVKYDSNDAIRQAQSRGWLAGRAPKCP